MQSLRLRGGGIGETDGRITSGDGGDDAAGERERVVERDRRGAARAKR